jgi:hypothetical protein
MISIFLSRPNSIDLKQQKTVDEINKLLISRGLTMRTIGTTDFPNVAPMRAVEQVMRECRGAIILGFPQIFLITGIMKPGTNQQVNISNKKIPTQWNHIEASVAYMLKLPMLIIRDEKIDGGIFDVGTTGHFLHTFDLSKQNWLSDQKFLQPFNDWHSEVISLSKMSQSI